MSDSALGLTRQTHATLSASELESLGRRAADEYLSGCSSLNDAVIKVAKCQASISSHQVRRITEFANQDAFNRLFEKQAGDKNVDFEVADPSVILKAMDDGSRPFTIQATASEYGSPPTKLASSNAAADIELCRMFGVELSSVAQEKTASTRDPLREALGKVAGDPIAEALESGTAKDPGAALSEGQVSTEANAETPNEEAVKTAGHIDEAARYVQMGRPGKEKVAAALAQHASLDRIKEATAGAGAYPDANPYRDLIDVHQKLAKLYEDSVHAAGESEWVVKEAQEELRSSIVEHLDDGGSFGEVVHLLGNISSGPDQVKVAMELLVPAMMEKGMSLPALQGELLAHDLTKKAHRVPNTGHPIAAAYVALNKAVENTEILKTARDGLNGEYDKANDLLQQAVHQHASSNK